MIKIFKNYIKNTSLEEFYVDMIKWSIMATVFFIILGLLT